MNRKDFLKSLGFLALAPLALRTAEESESHSYVVSRDEKKITCYKDLQLIYDEDLKSRMQYPLTYDESWKGVDNLILDELSKW